MILGFDPKAEPVRHDSPYKPIDPSRPGRRYSGVDWMARLFEKTTRLSADPQSPYYSRLAPQVSCWLNGELVPHAIEADRSEGWVVVHTDEILRIGDSYVLGSARVSGIVEFKLIK